MDLFWLKFNLRQYRGGAADKFKGKALVSMSYDVSEVKILFAFIC
jgi:hypothetical protein